MSDFWKGRSVFITGHTGFMGSWLASLLLRRGAKLTGLALKPAGTTPLFDALRLGDRLNEHRIADIRDARLVSEAMHEAKPSIVFHLAAQPLVRRAHAQPVETFATNVMGTVHVLDSAVASTNVEAVVAVTTDKVYVNLNRHEPYSETDALGGREPYSASKAASEMVASAWRHSYFAPRGVGLATVRAGNVFGGGDWADDRIVPDAIRCFRVGHALTLRNPRSTRPWQHVLDPLPGYLALAEKLVADPEKFSGAWNFGPAEHDCRPVGEFAALLARAWGDDSKVRVEPDERIFEERLLTLDSSKARQALGWTPRWPLNEAVCRAIDWYKAHEAGQDMWDVTQQQIDDFESAGDGGK